MGNAMQAERRGEDSIPKLRESSPGIFEFGLGQTTKPRIRLVVFLLIIGFATAVCGPGIVLSFGDWYSFALFIGFYLLSSVLVFVVLYASSSYIIDTNTRSLTRSRFLLNRRFRTTTWILSDNDEFTVYLSPDEYGTDAAHRISVTTNGHDRHFCDIRLPIVTVSQDLENWLDDLAKQLRIGNAGYKSTWTFFKRRLTLRL